ncbi:MAG: COP23 domain-containing protein [Leptolyngbya sp.]|nr:COP23 domain-containing protein [Leptolyngbya sp.]
MAILTHPWSTRLTISTSVAVLSLAAAMPLASLAQADAPTPPDPEPTAEDETPAPEEAAASFFACQMYQGRPTVMYAPGSQPGQMYPWAVPQNMGSAWPAQRRCETISARLESYRPDGLLTLDVGQENGYNVVCATTESVPGCRIVFTVPEGQDPTMTRDRVFANLASADQGQATEGVNTFVGNNENDILGQLGTQIGGSLGDLLGQPSTRPQAGVGNGAIDLRPFLAPADGGTGARLTGSAAAPRSTGGRPLNPDNFR